MAIVEGEPRLRNLAMYSERPRRNRVKFLYRVVEIETGLNPLGREDRVPTLFDYTAGAMLANGFVWIWYQALPYLSWVPATILADAEYVSFLLGGILSSYLVCRRTSSKHLFVGLKVAAAASVLNFFLVLSSNIENVLGFAIVVLVIFAVGGVAGAYLAPRSRLGQREAVGPASEEQE